MFVIWSWEAFAYGGSNAPAFYGEVSREAHYLSAVQRLFLFWMDSSWSFTVGIECTRGYNSNTRPMVVVGMVYNDFREKGKLPKTSKMELQTNLLMAYLELPSVTLTPTQDRVEARIALHDFNSTALPSSNQQH